MKLDQGYADPRFVILYDIENPRGVDTDFYLRLAADFDAKKFSTWDVARVCSPWSWQLWARGCGR